MSEKKVGRQTPTQSVVLPYKQTRGAEAVSLYNESGRTAIPWQELLCYDIMAVDEDGLWVHQKFGYSVPRRNGKNEVVVMRELWGLRHGEMICHTAHRTTTSTAAWKRLCEVLNKAGYTELGRRKRGESPPEKSYRTNKQHGLETIEVTGGGTIVFRTRTASGGLGEGFDLLVIDEAQEYTTEQETALIYTVTDSKNPQTIFCGTPPTLVSAGTVFTKMRESTLQGGRYATGWAEWSVETRPADLMDTEIWYETNPSMGYHLDERKIRAEYDGDKDPLDFIIQRLGYWFRYNLQSAISRAEWNALRCPVLPKLTGGLFLGVKYGKDGTNAAVSLAGRTEGGEIFLECLDCRPIREGNDWILDLIAGIRPQSVIIDGAAGQELLAEGMRQRGLKKPVLPKVKEIISANASFEQLLSAGNLRHMGQPSLAEVAANCEKRAIGTSGGFGYRSIKDTADICLLDSVILAVWLCSEGKEKKRQRVRY